MIHFFETDGEVAGYVADSLWMISIPRSSSSEDLKYNEKNDANIVKKNPKS